MLKDVACVEALKLALDQVTSGGLVASAALPQGVSWESLIVSDILHVINTGRCRQ